MLHSAIRNMPMPASPDDIRKLVLKLRWIGLEHEAQQLQSSLSEGEVAAIAPIETD
ncbi:MAG TPA: hypothetical protein VNW15_05880 [Rhizomicrobium sp.]|nr:hypothetical protein [Rhizomicrobium sp.]